MAGRHGLRKLDHSTAHQSGSTVPLSVAGVSLRQPRKTVAGFGLHSQVPLLRKHFMLSIAAADDVGDQIQDLVFRHAIEQALGHW